MAESVQVLTSQYTVKMNITTDIVTSGVPEKVCKDCEASTVYNLLFSLLTVLHI